MAEEFSVIYADPPWRYENATLNRLVENHYPTMETEEICAMKLPIAKNAVLFMWATAPKLEEALRVMSAWGFTYRTHAIWDKLKIGSGHWFRGQHELLMVGIRGKHSTPPAAKRISSVIRIKRGAHSSKPDQVRELIREWFPDERRLEVFARQWTSFWPVPEGWDVYGNQTQSTVSI